jgi:hypothetical protein
MELIVLKNGAEEAEPLVKVAMLSLESLIQSSPIAFYELVMKCRDSNHQFFGNTVERLKELSLVQRDGTIHDSVRNIVLSAAEGDGLDMKLVSPVPSNPSPLTVS